jgi:H-NS histone family
LRPYGKEQWLSVPNAISSGICLFQQYSYIDLFQEREMAKSNLASMSVDELLKLRDDVGTALSRRADELKNQLSRLGGEIGHTKRGRRASLKGRKVPIKYRDGSGNTWAGRGAQPVWLREKLKAGAKLEDFAVQKTVASRKVVPRKSKKRRRAKR